MNKALVFCCYTFFLNKTGACLDKLVFQSIALTHSKYLNPSYYEENMMPSSAPCQTWRELCNGYYFIVVLWVRKPNFKDTPWFAWYERQREDSRFWSGGVTYSWELLNQDVDNHTVLREFGCWAIYISWAITWKHEISNLIPEFLLIMQITSVNFLHIIKILCKSPSKII